MTPSLPPELQHEILRARIAHHVHFWSVSLGIMLNKYVQLTLCGVDCVFYEFVAIPNRASADKFLALIDSKPPGFFATTVKTLIISDKPAFMPASKSEAVRVILAACGVLSLGWPAFGGFSRHSKTWHQCSSSPHRQSGCHLGLWMHPLAKPGYLETLKQLPRLTHVALFPIPCEDRYADAVCASCRNLQLLVLLGTQLAPRATDADASLLDPRAIVVRGVHRHLAPYAESR
ncbi:hypothetical protein K438DRAFT_1964697 [Mycena galopus ATCC 62051]|nr:hypothetical protein K438DRAFT_1964697 [Mycena galopus ATCC 62051]